ncbi:GNAT family N-acetyltransferase [Enterococcus sp. 669A]|uniref:GNAT family N-acetyltransferase n=1 Tax=Candidatus Enterococcus moelleringii TaxID=2815325 RepID=A0ABS3LC41_9ENTE|nr:GNAT family N-acetyltransferase [Enterococcus sp. 669A]MBO1307194.1 GNAT family N-acetyltransferase [Enterococcus sp. 669A]
MVHIHISTPYSKEFFEAINLRKQLLDSKIDYRKERRYVTLVAIHNHKLIGTASIQLFTPSVGRIKEIAVLPEHADKNVEVKLIRFAEKYLNNRSKTKSILFGKKAKTSSTAA